MKRQLIVVVPFLFPLQASAYCPQNINFGDIPFEKNSSYFANKHTKQLQQLIEKTQSDNGYLLLEFPVFKGQTDKKLRQYDMWLANRRIERVRNYLSQSDYNQPVVTRILTASNTDSRTLSIHWCQPEHEQTIVADANQNLHNLE
ncbi:hypothetical protein [Shewanella psychrotolerans]|uniref:hypothetical protein n=1 Tax=Shewanella psychrotolerans TaxID=2864206 RepID=UPI001C659F9B|nr:hypothetical protein [Shewanella psychrotolerans]QYK02096.1 hypothetical protein K0I62_03725 [Shewanella psychrotolerans]